MDPVKKLAEMLSEASIPYEYIVEKFGDGKKHRSVFGCCEADMYTRNQIIYGRYNDNIWKLDAIWQYGSYGRYGGLLEVYGMMIGNEPKVYSTEEVFRMIEADWKKQ